MHGFMIYLHHKSPEFHFSFLRLLPTLVSNWDMVVMATQLFGLMLLIPFVITSGSLFKDFFSEYFQSDI